MIKLGGYNFAGSRLKVGGSNVSGFNLLFGGEREVDGSFEYIGEGGNIWLSGDVNPSEANCFYLTKDSVSVIQQSELKRMGHHVRCIKD